MIARKTLSVVLLILGAGVFAFGSYVASQAAQGEEQISWAEENEPVRRRPILGPVRRNVRNSAAANAQQRIGAAEQSVAQSQVTANWLHGTGIVLFVVGAVSLVLSVCRKKRH